MNLNGRSSLDPRWTKHHTVVAAGFMIATIKVIRKEPSAITGQHPTYNQTTQTWTGGEFTDIWTGNARIQPYGIIGDELVAQDTTGRRLMRVQINDLMSGIKLDDMISITASADAPELLGFDLEVRGTISSSNPWVTDLVCEANMKTNA